MTKCPACGGNAVKAKKLTKYLYDESGLDRVILTGNMVTEFACGDCGEKFVCIEAEQQLLQVLAFLVLMKHGVLVGKELRFVRTACRLTQDKLAQDLGIQRRQTILEWERESFPKRDWGSELLLRAVLLKRFKQAIDHENYLNPTHIRHLGDFERVFAQHFADFFSTAPPKAIRLESTQGAWQPNSYTYC